MTSIIHDISAQAQERLADEFPEQKVVVNLIQTHYFPTKGQTIFMVVADIGNRIYSSSGESTGKAIDRMIAQIREDKQTQSNFSKHEFA